MRTYTRGFAMVVVLASVALAAASCSNAELRGLRCVAGTGSSPVGWNGTRWPAKSTEPVHRLRHALSPAGSTRAAGQRATEGEARDWRARR